MQRLLPWIAVVGALLACIPPAGFARTPTPAPTLAPVDLCADYVRDTQRAYRDLQQTLTAQIQDLMAVAASGRPPDQPTAVRLSDRRDDLLRTAVIYERPAPCPEGERPRAQLAAAAVAIRQATRSLNDALDSDSPAVFREAATAYQRALLELTRATPAP
ncbi:MAG: hypothetical protein RMM58_10375 [Chloroflexota bacterium]|nr:hypothetical protein [Dehalococcoidia bacterium]MDW8254270.1 hypothetical protein [Chloroflexota bacterium]